MNLSNYLWGIDLGGTKIEGVIMKDDDPEIIARKRIPTEGDKGYEHIVSRISYLVKLLQQESKLKPSIIGIGTPGTLEPETQTLKNCNTTCLNGKPLKADLEKELGLSLKMANDANCFALAETRYGAAKEVTPHAEVVFGVIMGTGVGGGLVVNGRVINGLHGIGGEWGHNFLDESGGDCYCGKVGCVETVLSGKALEDYYYSLSGRKESLKFIYENHKAEIDQYATETIPRLDYFFGKAIAQVINIIDPEVIVLGGGVGNIDELYSKGLIAAQEFIFNPVVNTRFVKPKLGDSAGVFGAAALTKDFF